MRNNLRYFRRAFKMRGMTQKELAERIGITQPTVCDYERLGMRPRRRNRIKIAEALDVEVELLFPDAGV